MTKLERYMAMGLQAGCPREQMRNFAHADVVLQERQLAASAAARLCDGADGPTAVGYGGARGGGKSHWLLAQMGVDDCQRVPGLKCLLLRKVGKANMEHFEDLRRRLFAGLKHEFSAYRGVLTFANGSRIIAGHFQAEKDIDAYLGLEYDVIGIEEATTLSSRKHTDISTCCRTSKPNWRPRIYSTSNPGGIGHAWYRSKFIVPYQEKRETETRFIPARVTDNQYNNPEYRKVLESLNGWQRRAWLDGDWDLAAGQFFTTFRRDVHVITDFDETRAREWFAAMDYGFAHYTVFLLGCTDGDGNVFVVDEHAERLWLPQRHARAIREMLARHCVPVEGSLLSVEGGNTDNVTTRLPDNVTAGLADDVTTRLRDNGTATADAKLATRPLRIEDLRRIVAGADVFSRQSDGTTIAQQYAREGIKLRPATTDRVNGWAEVLQRLGEPGIRLAAQGEVLSEAGVPARLFIHQRCGRLAETLPAMQHDPNRPEDVLKVDADDDGVGGDDAADCLRYLVATKARTVRVEKLRGM